MKIYILTEGGGTKGMGHISRCSSLCEAFSAYGYEATMIVHADDTAMLAFGGEHIQLDWIGERQKTLALVSDAALAIIDSYTCPLELYEAIASSVRLAGYIDDEIRINYPRGVIVNGVLGADTMPYPVSDAHQLLLGASYCFLRRPFWEPLDKPIAAEVRSVMITCGGNDANDLTYQVARALLHEYPRLAIHVILKHRGIPQLDFFESQTIVHTSLSANEMLRLMMEVDIAVTASGQTTYELCRTGTPFVALVTADNQRFSIGNFYKSGLIPEPVDVHDPGFQDKVIKAMSILLPVNKRKEIQAVMQRAIDGQGSLRVAKYFLDILAKPIQQ